MSHLLVAVVIDKNAEISKAFETWGLVVNEMFGTPESARYINDGFGALVHGSPASCGLRKDDDGSVLTWCGVVVDPQSPAGTPLTFESSTDPTVMARYEGAFAAVTWDPVARRALILNDQASMMNLYVVESGGVLWVTTAAAPLAKALGLGLDPEGVCELMARGCLLAPTSFFSGMRRLGTGEHMLVVDGVVSSGHHWSPYRDIDNGISIGDAADRLAAVLTDRMKRLAGSREPVVADLSGGLDSRLVVAALDAAAVNFGVMTYGFPDGPDVPVATAIARAMGWPARYFSPDEFADVTMSDAFRRELLYRTAGELPFPAIFQGSLFRRELVGKYHLHMSGAIGELTRYFPWSQEFFGIGRRRPANVDNALRYRFLQDSFPAGMFSDGWLDSFSARLGNRIRFVCREGGNCATTTQQMDAVYLWKMTSHASLYISSTFGYLPTIAPLGMAGILDVNLSIPWWQKLTTGLNRHANDRLSPGVAAFRTSYGGTGAPPSLKTMPSEVRQTAMQIRHLVEKVERVALKGAVSKRLRPPAPPAHTVRPYLTPAFREMMRPDAMFSRAIYSPDFLDKFLQGSDIDLSSREPYLSRMATVEQFCRELDFHPEPGFLLKGPSL